MVNLPGPVDEVIGIAVMQTFLENPDLVFQGTKILVNSMTDMSLAIRRIGHSRFEMFWIPYRLLIGLQMRLWIETILFSMGKPWSDLVSGFKPLRARLKHFVGSEIL